MTKHGLTDAERFWMKVDKSGDSDCWQWTAAKTKGGYGHLLSREHGRMVVAHRFAYELLVAPIPDGLQLDHLCRNRGCVNPAHLEPVTAAENKRRGESILAQNARKTECVHGHEYTDENTVWVSNNGRRNRRCRECQRIADRLRRARSVAKSCPHCGGAL